jgi:prolyl oligopeptidase
VLRDGAWVQIDVPADVNLSSHREWLLFRPQRDWTVNGTTHPAGSLLAAGFEDFLAGSRDLAVLFTPDRHTSLQSWSWTRDFLLLNLLRDVSSEIHVLDPRHPGTDSAWAATVLDACPPLHDVNAFAVDDEDDAEGSDDDGTGGGAVISEGEAPGAGNDFWLVATGFTTPTTLTRGTLSRDSGSGAGARVVSTHEVIRTSPSFFNEADYDVEQHFAVSKDGTKVPYFQVAAKDLVLDGQNPTQLSGYGGFEISRTPAYSGAIGRAWLERRTAESAGAEGEAPHRRGGVYVVANIRGGGEYGPSWHRAALQGNRHRAYEDFAAVAADLISRGVTSRQRLGCVGGSNGGLLVGNMLAQYPELFGAVSCGVPLLDMRRYTKLSAGYSWIGEYGDPDVPEQWEFLKTFSPYHLLKDGVDYPETFIWTATSDDRVGPVQARKMAARMQAMGIPNVWFHEALEGGHAGASDNRQAAALQSRSQHFLWRALAGRDA